MQPIAALAPNPSPCSAQRFADRRAGGGQGADAVVPVQQGHDDGARPGAGAASYLVPQIGASTRVMAFTGQAAPQDPQPMQSAAETSGEAPPSSVGTTRIAL